MSDPARADGMAASALPDIDDGAATRSRNGAEMRAKVAGNDRHGPSMHRSDESLDKPREHAQPYADAQLPQRSSVCNASQLSGNRPMSPSMRETP